MYYSSARLRASCGKFTPCAFIAAVDMTLHLPAAVAPLDPETDPTRVFFDKPQLVYRRIYILHVFAPAQINNNTIQRRSFDTQYIISEVCITC